MASLSRSNNSSPKPSTSARSEPVWLPTNPPMFIPTNQPIYDGRSASDSEISIDTEQMRSIQTRRRVIYNATSNSTDLPKNLISDDDKKRLKAESQRRDSIKPKVEQSSENSDKLEIIRLRKENERLKKIIEAYENQSLQQVLRQVRATDQQPRLKQSALPKGEQLITAKSTKDDQSSSNLKIGMRVGVIEPSQINNANLAHCLAESAPLTEVNRTNTNKENAPRAKSSKRNKKKKILESPKDDQQHIPKNQPLKQQPESLTNQQKSFPSVRQQQKQKIQASQINPKTNSKKNQQPQSRQQQIMSHCQILSKQTRPQQQPKQAQPQQKPKQVQPRQQPKQVQPQQKLKQVQLQQQPKKVQPQQQFKKSNIQNQPPPQPHPKPPLLPVKSLVNPPSMPTSSPGPSRIKIGSRIAANFDNKGLSKNGKIFLPDSEFDEKVFKVVAKDETASTFVKNNFFELSKHGDTVLRIDNLPAKLTIHALNLMMGTCSIGEKQIVACSTSGPKGKPCMNVRIVMKRGNPDIDRILVKDSAKTMYDTKLLIRQTTLKELENFLIKNCVHMIRLEASQLFPGARDGIGYAKA